MNDWDLEELSRKIAYHFQDDTLLQNALIHSSYANEHGLPYRSNNERLEFLGDAFFDAVIAEKLCQTLPQDEEGNLSKIRASIVCEESLLRKAEELDLSAYIRLGVGEARSARAFGYRAFEADALEAVFGAVFLDGGYEEVRRVILSLFGDIIEDGLRGRLRKDYKSMLQETHQSVSPVRIEYEIVDETGPDHNKIFYAVVKREGEVIGSGSGKSKKSAEQSAAEKALENLKAFSDRSGNVQEPDSSFRE